MSQVEERLAELGITVPEVVPPLAAYKPAVVVGDVVYISGQLPLVNGELPLTGKLGAEVTEEQGYDLARQCGINMIGALKYALGDLDRVAQIAKLGGFVASTPDFTGQPGVVNGASELLGQVFGEAGEHARSAVGVPSLPLNTPVEIDAIVTL
ncbi:RidA family protein [Nesterenkonia alba]|uniref:RidA family protein n=1 Tax=Nesterenkonia alba TaxID=515814 RepID=UPI0003F7F1B1|nr:RidA family protein [Nesterenkonia alba]